MSYDNGLNSSGDADAEYVPDDVVIENSVPLDIHIGFYSNVTKKQVEKHVLSYAQKNFSSLNDVYYQVQKYQDGFLFEIQQGGSGKGYLQDYLDNNYDNPLIITSDNIYRASESVHGGIRLVKLTDDDVKVVIAEPEKFEILAVSKELNKLVNSGYGFYLFGLIFLVIGILSLGISASVKYLIVDKTDAIYFTNVNKEYPYQYIPKIKNEMYKMDLSSEFFKNFTLNTSLPEGSKWKVNKGSILSESQEVIENVDGKGN